ncbi:MAG: hypothetical protein ABI723_04995 [Bacteroidia bacterium]
MRTILSALLTAALIFINLIQLQAQDHQRIPLVNSGEAITEGVKLHDDGKFKEAIAKYLSINRNDTNYAYALSELVTSYLASGDSIKAIETCKKGIALNSEYSINFYLLLGNAYDIADSLDKAIASYDEGIKRFPYHYKYYFEKGVAYAVHNKDSLAVQCFQKAIRLNPLHAGSHFQLAVLAMRNNKFVEALLSFQMFLLIENTSKRSVSALGNIEKIAGGEYKVNKDSVIDIVYGNDHFEDIDEIIRSKTALDDKYKTNVKLTYLKIVKTMQALNEKLQYNAADKGFWMQTYVPLFSELWKNNYFDALMYLSFGGVKEDAVQKAYKDNKSKIDKMVDFAGDYVAFKMNREKIKVNGNEFTGYINLYNNKNIKSVGDYDTKAKINKGPWVYFHPSGGVKSFGNYNDKGLVQGEWKYYYPEGGLRKIVNYDNDKVSGLSQSFYKNGQLSEKGTYQNEIYQGVVEYYYSTGVMSAKGTFKDGKTEGEIIINHENGKLKKKYSSKNNLNDGSYHEYYSDGTLYIETTYINGKENGTQKKYNPDGTLMSEGKVVNDLYEGEWKVYFDNGILKRTGSFKGGKETGIWKEFHENGKLYSESEMNNGTIDGLNKLFDDDDGIQYAEIQYKNGNMKKYKYMDKTGKIISQGEEKGGKLDFVSWFPAGSCKNTEGKLVDGKVEGLWTSYHKTGKKVNEINYKDGLKNGEATYYFKNGNVKEKAAYKDGKVDGYLIYYYKNGNIQKEGWYADDMAQGEWHEYYPDKTISEINYYLNDKSYGCQQQFDESGRLQYENCFDENDLLAVSSSYDTANHIICRQEFIKGALDFKSLHLNKSVDQKVTFKNGEKDGEGTWFFPNGEKRIVQSFANGQRNGKRVEYYYNGKVKDEDFYKNNLIDSISKNYNENGTISSVFHYRQGDVEDSAFWYDDKGKLSLTGKYKRDEREGYFVYYAADGITPRYRLKYSDGNIIAYSYLDKNGKYIEDVPVIKQTVSFTSYYPNGNKSAEINVMDGFNEGKRTYYYMNGKIESTEVFIAGDESGLSKEYYDNGQTKNEKNYLGGNLYGSSKYYNEKGILVKQENYLNGSKEGLLITYDDVTGKQKKKLRYVNDIPYE